MNPTAQLGPFTESDRLQSLPPYIFAQLDLMKEVAREQGADLIDLGMGNPDIPTPQPVVDRAIEALKDPQNHRYPTFNGRASLRQAIAHWYRERYGVELDPETEVLPLIGSKEGLAHLAFAYVNPGDVTLAPGICYPVHARGTIMAGGRSELMPMDADYQIDFDRVDPELARKAKLMFFNYPNNPTTAVADRSLFERAVKFGHDTGTLLVHDQAYAELAFDGFKPTSLLEIPGGREIGVEFHTFSKTFSMAGWRCGFVVGNSRIIASLLKVKTNLDYGLFPVIQEAAIAALNLPQSVIDGVVDIYRERRDIVVDGLQALGYDVKRPKATMYVWVRCPEGYTSGEFAKKLIEEVGVVVTPGTAFGTFGEGFFRISLIVGPDRLKEAMARIAKVQF